MNDTERTLRELLDRQARSIGDHGRTSPAEVLHRARRRRVLTVSAALSLIAVLILGSMALLAPSRLSAPHFGPSGEPMVQTLCVGSCDVLPDGEAVSGGDGVFSFENCFVEGDGQRGGGGGPITLLEKGSGFTSELAEFLGLEDGCAAVLNSAPGATGTATLMDQKLDLDRALARIRRLLNVEVSLPEPLASARPRSVLSAFSRSAVALYLVLPDGRDISLDFGSAVWGCGDGARFPDEETVVGGQPAVLRRFGGGRLSIHWPATLGDTDGAFGITGRASRDELLSWATQLDDGTGSVAEAGGGC